MREILFRGKRKDNGEWVEGYLVKHETNYVIINASAGSLGFGVQVIPETVGQFTGLLDKNGKKIFEGDIVLEFYTKRYEVYFDYDRGGWFPFACGDGCGCCEDDTTQPLYCRVIGNKYDNPELLKGAE